MVSRRKFGPLRTQKMNNERATSNVAFESIKYRYLHQANAFPPVVLLGCREGGQAAHPKQSGPVAAKQAGPLGTVVPELTPLLTYTLSSAYG